MFVSEQVIHSVTLTLYELGNGIRDGEEMATFMISCWKKSFYIVRECILKPELYKQILMKLCGGLGMAQEWNYSILVLIHLFCEFWVVFDDSLY